MTHEATWRPLTCWSEGSLKRNTAVLWLIGSFFSSYTWRLGFYASLNFFKTWTYLESSEFFGTERCRRRGCIGKSSSRRLVQTIGTEAYWRYNHRGSCQPLVRALVAFSCRSTVKSVLHFHRQYLVWHIQKGACVYLRLLLLLLDVQSARRQFETWVTWEKEVKQVKKARNVTPAVYFTPYANNVISHFPGLRAQLPRILTDRCKMGKLQRSARRICRQNMDNITKKHWNWVQSAGRYWFDNKTLDDEIRGRWCVLAGLQCGVWDKIYKNKWVFHLKSVKRRMPAFV